MREQTTNMNVTGKTEKISVIIPCYNGARTLGRCLESVMAQTYGDLEILVIDDGSSDNSCELACAYAKKDARIRVLSKRNGGVSSARNLGLEMATGEYISFIDCDDEYAPEMLGKMYAALKKAGAEMAVCNFEGNPMFKSFFTDRVFDLSVRRDLLEYYRETVGALVPWNKLISRAVIGGERFDESVHFSEDDLFNLAILKNIAKIVTLKDKFYTYHFKKMEEECAEEASCLSKVVAKKKIYEDKDSIFYLGARLTPRRIRYIQSAMDAGKLPIDDIDDMAYLRVTGYFLWEIYAYAAMGTDPEELTTEVRGVMEEEIFRKAVHAQEKNGFRYLYDTFTEAEKKQTSERYVHLCLKAFEDERAGNFDAVFVNYLLFAKMFMRAEGVCDTSNPLAAALNELEHGDSDAAKYARALGSFAPGCFRGVGYKCVPAAFFKHKD